MTRRDALQRVASGLMLPAATYTQGCGRKQATLRGHAFVALEREDSLAVVSLAGFAIRRRIPIGGPVQGLTLSPRGESLWAPAAGDAAIYQVSLPDERVTRIGVPAEAVQPKWEPEAKRVWVALRGKPGLAWFEGDHKKPAGILALPSEAVFYDICEQGDIGCAALSDGSLAFFILSTRKLTGVVSGLEKAGAVLLRFDGRVALAADPAQNLLRCFDTVTRRLMVDLPLPLRPDHLCWKPDGGQLFLTGKGRDAVSIVYPYRTEVGQTNLTGRSPGVMAISSAPDYLFVANPAASSVTVFDVATQRVLAVVSVGADPRQIVITPDQQFALVMNYGSGDMALIRTAAITGGRAKAAPLFTMIPVGERPFATVVTA